MKVLPRQHTQATQASVEVVPVQRSGVEPTPAVTTSMTQYQVTRESADRPASARSTKASVPLHGSALQVQLDRVGKAELQEAWRVGVATAGLLAQGEGALVGADIDALFSAWLQSRLRESAKEGLSAVEQRLRSVEHLLAAGLVGPGSHAEMVLEKAGLISLHQKMTRLQERSAEIDRQVKRPQSSEGRAALELERNALTALLQGYSQLHARLAVADGVGVEVLRAMQGGLPAIAARLDALQDGAGGDVEVERAALRALQQDLQLLLDPAKS
ncbi:MAG: hypothetical protein AB2A00_06105 [Myxococcota bacterium]